ncbi:MAG: hypothetical protein ACLTBF_04940 [Christensenellales bacterium]
MVDMMREFSVTVVGVCVLISTQEPAKKRLDGVKSLLVIERGGREHGQRRTSARRTGFPQAVRRTRRKAGDNRALP